MQLETQLQQMSQESSSHNKVSKESFDLNSTSLPSDR